MAEEMGPLSEMMIANGEMIELVIEKFGPSAVSEFFINVGTGIAAMYETSDIPQGDIASIDAGEDK